MDSMKDALRKAVPDLGDSILEAGSGHSAKESASAVPTIDCGTFTPAAPQTPAPNPNEPKILRFIKLCRVTDGLTVREVAGGTQLPLADTRAALESLVASGILTVTGEPETEFQRRRYNLPTVAAAAAPAPEPYENPDIRINRAAQAERERDKRAHAAPEPPQVHYPTDAEVQAILDAKEAERKSIVFTPEEQAQLKLMDGRLTGLNPQRALKR